METRVMTQAEQIPLFTIKSLCWNKKTFESNCDAKSNGSQTRPLYLYSYTRLAVCILVYESASYKNNFAIKLQHKLPSLLLRANHHSCISLYTALTFFSFLVMLIKFFL